MATKVSPYLKTLRRVPDDIILSVATRRIVPISPEACICGWVLRESLARMANTDAAHVDPYANSNASVVSGCTEQFGGEWQDWDNIFCGIGTRRAGEDIEFAFVDRVLECVS